MRVLKKELWPHKVRVNLVQEKTTEVENWLDQRMGTYRIKWNVVYRYSGADYYFKRGKDATMFSLMWSGS